MKEQSRVRKQEKGPGRRPHGKEARVRRPDMVRKKGEVRGQAGSRGGSSGWGSFRRQKSLEPQVIRYDRYRLSVLEWLLALAKGTAACGLLSYTFYRSMTAFFLMLPAAALFPIYERRRRKERRLEELAAQMKEGMMILAGNLSSGFAIENALSVSRDELVMMYGEEGLLPREFAYMAQQVRVNRTAEEVLEDLAERSGLEDIRNFSEGFSVAKRSGGDLSGIMRHTAEVLRDKMQVREEIRTMTASRQFEQKIMSLIPFLIVFYVEGASPGFFGQMYGTSLGRVLMSGCLAAYLISLALAGKFLDIRV